MRGACEESGVLDRKEASGRIDGVGELWTRPRAIGDEMLTVLARWCDRDVMVELITGGISRFDC